ncbi:MAG: hypothetical protein H6R07_2178 [Proteobacteria bacterium]|nr:hypothetical protein [Pseudomonadota bacterium]
MDKKADRIEALFKQTKPVCFGRFLIDVPATAQVVWGPTTIRNGIVSYPSQGHKMAAEIQAKVTELKGIKHIREPSTFIGTFDGPNPDSRIVVGYSDFESSGLVQLHSYIRLGKHAFVQKADTLVLDDLPNGGDDKTSYKKYIPIFQDIARRLRVREETETPTEPGICLENGFVRLANSPYGERVAIGFRFPEYPDVSFSVRSFKTDRPNPSESLERGLKEAREIGAIMGMGQWFSSIKTLREGKRQIGGWDGYEKLARLPSQEKNKPTTHEFRFKSIGAANDMFRPVVDLEMSTGVDEDSKGELEPSLKNEEAVALWDRLTSAIKVRPTK